MTIRLEAGDPAPPFALPDPDGQLLRLSDFAGGRVIVYFYPAAMTPGCTTQAVDFSAAAEEFTDAGLAVVGISPDPVAKLQQFRAAQQVGFPLLSDPDRAVLDAYGAFGEKILYGKEMQGVIRSTFVIAVDPNGQGTIELAQYNVRAKGHVDKLRRELEV